MVAYDKHVTLIIQGQNTKVDGFVPWDIIYDVTSYMAQGYRFSPRFRMGHWDGRKKLFSRQTRTFPSGLTSTVQAALEKHGIAVTIEDQRDAPPPPDLGTWLQDINLHGVSFDYPYDYQPKVADAMLRNQRGIVAVATNGGKTEIACLVTAALRAPTLFMVPGKELLYQTAERFRKRLGLSEEQVGVVGDGVWKPGTWITVGTAATLSRGLKKAKVRDLLETIDVVFADECHMAASDSWYKVLRACGAFYRFGLSGTPLKRSDGADLRLIGVTGDIIYEIRNKYLIEHGISNSVEIQFLKVTEPKGIPKGTPWDDVYKLGIVENTHRHTELCRRVAEFVAQGKQCVMMVKELEHGRQLSAHLDSSITHKFINGKESSDVRRNAIKDYVNGDLQVLIVTSILDQGVDIPNIDVLVPAGGGKSSIKTLQRVGRGIRRGGSSDCLIVLETADLTHRYLTEHSLQRMKDYKEEECFAINVL
jgi:superfamily II DNA or RNA helicase